VGRCPWATKFILKPKAEVGL